MESLSISCFFFFSFFKLKIDRTFPTHLCPNSWVMVCASVIPLSSLTLQLRSGWHMPATWATPRVLHGVFALEQMSSLVTRIATSWWFGCESSTGFSFCCHLQKLYSVLSAFTVMSSPCWKQTLVGPFRGQLNRNARIFSRRGIRFRSFSGYGLRACQPIRTFDIALAFKRFPRDSFNQRNDPIFYGWWTRVMWNRFDALFSDFGSTGTIVVS